MLTIILFPLGLFIGLSFIWIPAFFKGNKYSSIDKIEELDLIVEAFKEKYKEPLKKEIND